MTRQGGPRDQPIKAESTVRTHAPQGPQEGPAMRTLRLLDEEAVREGQEPLPARESPVALPPVRLDRGREAPGVAGIGAYVLQSLLSAKPQEHPPTVLYAEPRERRVTINEETFRIPDGTHVRLRIDNGGGAR